MAGIHTENQSDVMISTGIFEKRVVRTTKKHPQVGTIRYRGKRALVCIAFYLDDPVWELVDGPDDPEYQYCVEKTMPIWEDPDYCGDDEDGEEME